MRMSLNKYIIVFFVATALLLSGLILMWYVQGKIDGYQHMLTLGGLSVYDIGMITGTLDWWIIQKSMLFDLISYLLIASGTIAYGFAISTRYLSFKKDSFKNTSYPTSKIDFSKKINSKEIDKQLEIDLLKSKIIQYEKKIMTSNSRIKNLKENMDYLVNIINQLQEKSIPVTTMNIKKR